MTTDTIVRQLTETTRNVKANVVKKEVSMLNGADIVSAASGSESDNRTFYRCGEKGHISPDGANRRIRGSKPKGTYNNRVYEGLYTR